MNNPLIIAVVILGISQILMAISFIKMLSDQRNLLRKTNEAALAENKRVSYLIEKQSPPVCSNAIPPAGNVVSFAAQESGKEMSEVVT